MDLRSRRDFPSYFNRSQLSYTKLPTYIDIYNNYMFVKIKDSKYAKKETVQRLLDIWNAASLPSFSQYYIFKKISVYIIVVDNLFKSSSHKNYNKYCKRHFEKYNILFDICPCKCSISKVCHCDVKERVPEAEAEFLQDQRTTRMRTIQLRNTSTSIKSNYRETEAS